MNRRFELKVWNRIELVLVWSTILKSVSNKRVSATNDPVWIKEIKKNSILELLLLKKVIGALIAQEGKESC